MQNCLIVSKSNEYHKRRHKVDMTPSVGVLERDGQGGATDAAHQSGRGEKAEHRVARSALTVKRNRHLEDEDIWNKQSWQLTRFGNQQARALEQEGHIGPRAAPHKNSWNSSTWNESLEPNMATAEAASVRQATSVFRGPKWSARGPSTICFHTVPKR